MLALPMTTGQFHRYEDNAFILDLRPLYLKPKALVNRNRKQRGINRKAFSIPAFKHSGFRMLPQT